MPTTWEDIEQLGRTEPEIHAALTAEHQGYATRLQALMEMVVLIAGSRDSLRRSLTAYAEAYPAPASLRHPEVK